MIYQEVRSLQSGVKRWTNCSSVIGLLSTSRQTPYIVSPSKLNKAQSRSVTSYRWRKNLTRPIATMSTYFERRSFERTISSHLYSSGTKFEKPDPIKAEIRESFGGPRTFESPIVKLWVGPNDVEIFVHRDKLIDIPSFAMALRQTTLQNGAGNSIRLVEDPEIFRHVVEFLYTGEFQPKLYKQEDDCGYVDQSLCEDCCQQDSSTDVNITKQENLKQDGSCHVNFSNSSQIQLTSGEHVLTATSYQVLKRILLILCLSDRHCMDKLSKMCIEKLRLFPCGAKEIILLTDILLERIQSDESEILKVVQKKLAKGLRLWRDCAEFWALFNNHDAAFNQRLSKIISITLKMEQRALAIPRRDIAVCISDVTPNNDNSKSYSSYGCAKAGELIFVESHDHPDNFYGIYPLDLDSPYRFSAQFPKKSFRFFKVSDWPKESDTH